MPDAAAFRELLRRCSQPDRIAPLLSALGYQPMTPTPSSLCGDIVGERPGSCALLVQPADNFSRADVTRIARPLRDELSRQYLLIIAAPSFRELVFAAWGLDGTLRSLSVDRADVRASDLDTLVELVAAPNEGSSALALRYGRALDRSRVTRRFFVDFREVRTLVSTAWKGLPRAATSERDQLALLFLCRMMFLYFLQRRRHLAGNQAYLVGLWHRWRRNASEGTFYASVIRPLFFQALNRRPEQRTQEARALGDLPYLNGGLFEIHALERRFPRLDLADESVRHVFDDLLERYRFTTCDVADASADGLLDSAIDPEMLGRVFEGLMLQTRRGDTGTFFTPAGVVDRLVTEALAVGIANHIPQLSLEAARTVVQTCDASGLPPEDRRKLRSQVSALRVLDPACGSGAFLLGVLSRLTRLRTGLEERSVGDVRRDIVATALHGVDVQPDAALLCALRLWLSLAVEDPLTPERVQPLPNLDRRIRQGDALLDPLDIASHVQAADTEVRSCIRSLTPLSRRYLHAEPDERIELRRSLVLAERALAESWIRSLDRRLTREHAELVATSGERDLFGLETADAQAARAALPELARRKDELLRLQSELTEKDAVPFFSFKIHFAESTENGFDMVLSNPPWVRAHRWPAALGRLVKARYAVCRDPGWREGTRLAGAPVAAAAQVDLALLFLERSIALLAPGGTLGILLPAKILRSLFGAAARRMLLRDLTLVSVEDHSLDQRSIFQADSFALSIIARKTPNHSDAPVQITLVRRGMPSFHFAARHSDLPLLPDDHDAPWILAPEGVRQTLRKMQKAGTAIGHRHGMRVRRGVFTGANHVLIVREAIARIGDLATIKTEGAFAKSTPSNTAHASYEALIEAGALRPLVRGSDIAAWQYKSERSIIWVHGPNGSAAPRFPRLDRYLAKHRAVLQKRAGVTSRHATGAIFRLTADTLRPKVAWQDIADTLNAVALPATIRSRLGQDGHLIPLNTVYFLPVSNPDRALLLAAYLNSLPLRTFARVIAERAKDACFRFFAWTIAALPLPDRWDLDDSARVLLRISEDAHSRGFLTTDAESELNGIVADRYGLSPEDRAALHVFDRWLKGLS